MAIVEGRGVAEHRKEGTEGRWAPPAGTLPGFAVRGLVAIALVALALLAWTVQDVLLLLFGAVLVGVILRAAADGLRKILPLPETAALVIAGLLILAVLYIAGSIFGQEVSRQVQQLGSVLPQAWDEFRTWIGARPMALLREEMMPSGSDLAGIAQTILSMLTATLTGLVLAVVGGVYLAASPRLYSHGTLRLLPRGGREAVADFFGIAGHSLRRWLLARLAAMILIGLITYAGLTLIGVPSALALAIIAGFLEFIPFAGPILSAIPALLLALTIGPQTAIFTLLLYVAVQQLEGNVITPLFLKRAVELPPAVTLFSLFLFGSLFGIVGVLLAGPLTVVTYIAIRCLWMQHTLDEDVEYAAGGKESREDGT